MIAADSACLGRIDADLHLHRVGAGGDVLEALRDDRLGQHRRGRRAVAGDVLGLGRGFLEQLGAHVLEGVVELDVARDRDAVMGDGRGAVLLVQRDVAALGTERRADGIRERVDAALQVRAGFLVVGDELGHLASCGAPAGARVASVCQSGAARQTRPCGRPSLTLRCRPAHDAGH